MNAGITKTEYESAVGAVNKILSQSVNDIKISDDLPLTDDIMDSNKVYKGKLSMMFVDMRNSTDLTDEIKSKKMVKVYRSFIRLVIQAIRYSGGQARYFAGDGIMGVFQDSTDEDEFVKSSVKAIYAARYIVTLIDYILNPCLSKHLPEICIGCGIGVCTGEIMIAKVGMRGNEADNTVENELGLVWVGSTTNYASRMCGLANSREIFIDEKTFNESGSGGGWEAVSRTKGTKVFNGYISCGNYLELPEDAVEPIQADIEFEPEDNFIQETLQIAHEKATAFVDGISEKSAELSVALADVKKREEQISIREAQSVKENNQLQQWQNALDNKNLAINKKEADNKSSEYRINRDFFSTAYPSDPLIKQIGKDFWVKLIDKMFDLGSLVGYSKDDVIIDLNYYLIDIYCNFEMYQEAYEVLCVCAKSKSKIMFRHFEEIIKKSGHGYALKNELENRVDSEAAQALQKLKSLGY